MTDLFCLIPNTISGLCFQAVGQIIILLFFLWRRGLTQAMASSFLRFLDHKQRRITVGRTPLDRDQCVAETST